MGEREDFDLDLSSARAWSAFGARLAAHLATITDSDSTVVGVLTGEEPDNGSAPYVQFAGFSGDQVRGEVSGNRYLAPQYALDDQQHSVLLRHGWRTEGENYFVHMATADAHRLAVMAVRALRDVLHVPHPAFLIAYSPVTADSLGLGTAPQEPTVVVDEPLAVVPENRDHLVELVDQALSVLFGHRPRRDDDDDIPIIHRSSLLFVRVDTKEPLVELFSYVVRDVTDAEAARVEVAILNRDVKFIKFVAYKNHVLARLQIPCYPFVPGQLRSMVQFMSSALDEVDDDLSLRTGGKPALHGDASGSDGEAGDEQSSVGPLHPALQQLLALDDGAGARQRELAQHLCGDDPALLNSLLDTAADMQIRLWKGREEALLAGDDVAAADCESGSRQWGRLHDVLRRVRVGGDVPSLEDDVGGRGQGLSLLYQSFWERFEGPAKARGWTQAKPPTRHWWSMPGGATGVHWTVSFATFGCRSELYFGHADPRVNLHRFEQLHRQRERIQAAFGVDELLFDELPHAKACRIETRLEGPTVQDTDAWDDVVTWMIDRQERLRAAIASVGGIPMSMPE